MKKLVVLGGGESGVGTAILGKKMGFDVFVSDNGVIEAKARQVLLNNDIDIVLYEIYLHVIQLSIIQLLQLFIVVTTIIVDIAIVIVIVFH